MKKTILALGALALLASTPLASAATRTAEYKECRRLLFWYVCSQPIHSLSRSQMIHESEHGFARTSRKSSMRMSPARTPSSTS